MARASFWLVLLASCTSTAFRATTVPEVVPRDPRTGCTHYTLRIDSRTRRRARIGTDGPWLPPRGTIRIERDLPPGVDVDVVELTYADGRKEQLRVPVRTRETSVADERRIPLPALGGWEVRVTAGFHAPNHRQPGRRMALDVVPVTPRGRVLGTEVRSPFPGVVLAVVSDQPDSGMGRANELTVRADGGNVFRYAHFEQHSVRLRPGERFCRGALLGRIGMSGNTTGPHLHIEWLGRLPN